MDLLEIVLVNAERFHYTSLINCACVTKSHREIVKQIWKDKVLSFEKPIYLEHTGKKCRKCHKNNADNVFATCYRCTSDLSLITATDAKKLWYLNDDDLEDLNVHETFQRKYRQYIRLFALDEVRDFAIIKWNPWGLWVKRNKKNTISKAMETRIKKVDGMDLNLEKGGQKWTVCIEPFLKNGKGGVKGIKDRLCAFDEFLEIVSGIENRSSLSVNAFENVLCEYCDANKEERPIIVDKMIRGIEKAVRMQQRRADLVERLKNVGLSLRADSKMCADYLNGYRDDVETVVETMREMNWLFSNTSYANVMSNLIDQWKKDFRSDYGWHSDFHEMLNDDMPQLSQRAKKFVVRKIALSDLPSFMVKYKN
jgi:hypothetical protein